MLTVELPEGKSVEVEVGATVVVVLVGVPEVVVGLAVVVAPEPAVTMIIKIVSKINQSKIFLIGLLHTLVVIGTIVVVIGLAIYDVLCFTCVRKIEIIVYIW